MFHYVCYEDLDKLYGFDQCIIQVSYIPNLVSQGSHVSQQLH
jgi:hypothetical protein